VILEDGTPLRVSYDSHNGYSYSSFERVLAERNLIPRAEMSRERIRGWMAAHPEEAARVRAANRAYAFFRITGLTNDGEPVGAQGVPLTPGRSIAVDRVHEYGTPFFIEATLPIESTKPASPFRRLMIAQDTGSAIVGPARADLYLGAGDDAGRIANRIRHPGRFAMLLPRELDLAAAGGGMPLPVAKPKLDASEVAKLDDAGKQGDTAKHDGKGRAESHAGAITDGRNARLPEAKPKLAALDAAKPEAKGKPNSASAPATAAARHPPVPKPTPKLAALDIAKQDGKGKANSVRLPVLKPKDADVKKADAKTQNARQQNVNDKKDKADSAWTVAGRQKPAPSSKQKISETEVKKPNANGKTESAISKLAAGKPATGKLAAEKQTPSSSSKSKSSEAEVRKSSGIEARKPDGKGKTEPATAGKLAGKPTPASAAKSKTPEPDAKKDARKPDGKGKANSASSGDDAKAATKPGRQADSARKSSRALN
jgi:3D (Asp-Asp-Asp) domain-containing protein